MPAVSMEFHWTSFALPFFLLSTTAEQRFTHQACYNSGCPKISHFLLHTILIMGHLWRCSGDVANNKEIKHTPPHIQQGSPQGTGRLGAVAAPCSPGSHSNHQTFCKRVSLLPLSSADPGAFSTLVPASLLSESCRSLGWAHRAQSTSSDVHPTGFTFIPKTCFSLTDLLLQIRWEKGQNRAPSTQ